MSFVAPVVLALKLMIYTSTIKHIAGKKKSWKNDSLESLRMYKINLVTVSFGDSERLQASSWSNLDVNRFDLGQ